MPGTQFAQASEVAESAHHDGKEEHGGEECFTQLAAQS